MLNLVAMLALLAQSPLEGKWSGEFTPGKSKVTVQLELRLDSDRWTGTAQSPQMGNEAVALANLVVAGNNLSFRIDEIGANYEGIYDPATDRIVGKIKRRTQLELNLTRGWASEPLKRDQEIREQVHYRVRPITARATDGAKLSGTCFEPKNAKACVVLIAGSGDLDRDATVFDHKPFLVIAHYLAQHGIASVRFDKRGIGQSTGDYRKASLQTLSTDAVLMGRAAGFKNPAYLGFSQGANVAALIPDARLVLLSPIAVNLAPTASDSLDEPTKESLSFGLATRLKGRQALAILGDLDKEYSSTKSYELLRQNGLEAHLLKGRNHLLQPAKSGDIGEIRLNPVTIDPLVLKQVATWLAGHRNQ